MDFKHFELHQDTGKLYILANECEEPKEPKSTFHPVLDEMSLWEYGKQIKEWQSKHVRLEFADGEYEKVCKELICEDFKNLEKGMGVTINCVEVKEVDNYVSKRKGSVFTLKSIYKAYFKNPDQPKERLYTEEEVKQKCIEFAEKIHKSHWNKDMRHNNWFHIDTDIENISTIELYNEIYKP